MKRDRRHRPPVQAPSVFAGFRFPPEVNFVAVRWYLRYGLSCRDLEELLAERGVEVDQVTLFRWVQRFTPELIDAARPCRLTVGDRWFVDQTYVTVAGVWRYVYRAVDQHGQVIDVYVSTRRDIAAARRFFATAPTAHGDPFEVITDRAPALANVIDELIPAAFHNTGQYQNNRCECDRRRLKARLRPMRGLKTNRTASVVIRGHAFVQNLRRGHYELGTEAAPIGRLAAAFDELALGSCPGQSDQPGIRATAERLTQRCPHINGRRSTQRPEQRRRCAWRCGGCRASRLGEVDCGELRRRARPSGSIPWAVY